MSIGFTGVIFRVFATRFLKTVTVRFVGEYETEHTRTTSEGVRKKLKFQSKWLAELYAKRITNGQYHRYEGTDKDCGFRKPRY